MCYSTHLQRSENNWPFSSILSWPSLYVSSFLAELSCLYLPSQHKNSRITEEHPYVFFLWLLVPRLNDTCFYPLSHHHLNSIVTGFHCCFVLLLFCYLFLLVIQEFPTMHLIICTPLPTLLRSTPFSTCLILCVLPFSAHQDWFVLHTYS